MRAVQISAWTDPADLAVAEVDPPICSADAVRIRVAAASVSYALSLLVAGRYQRKPPFPFIPGNTVAGTVIEVGAEVTRFRAGDRVLASIELGGLAEEAVAPEVNVYALPPSLPFAQAPAFNTAYNSTAAALTWPHLLAVGPEDVLLIHGAAGGVGTAAIEIGRHLGATIIATASSGSKRAFAASRGAHHALAADPEALRDAVMEATDGRGVTRVFDPVGGQTFLQSLRCLRPEGRILPIGFAGGDIPKIPANLLMVKNITVCGLYMGYYKIDRRDHYAPRVRAIFEQLGRWYEDGVIAPHVSAIYPLDEVPAAFARVLDRANIGHVVVRISGEA